MTTDLDTFKKLYLQQFNVNLTDVEAERKARSLMRVYGAVYGSPELKNNYAKSQISRASEAKS